MKRNQFNGLDVTRKPATRGNNYVPNVFKYQTRVLFSSDLFLCNLFQRSKRIILYHISDIKSVKRRHHCLI